MAEDTGETIVAEEEMELPDDEYIVSRTNTEGIITYVSDSFCRISEFTKEELLGMPHNIIRHPDMPRSAFKDMWETIRQGKKWQGYVKNRTKNGKFYWVDATVSPFVKDGKMLGYKSVRQKPDPEILAEKIYQYRELLAKEQKETNGENKDAGGFTLSGTQAARLGRLAGKMKMENSVLMDRMLAMMEKKAGE